MTLDKKIKKAAFQTAIHRLLRNRSKSPRRTARNLLEAGVLLAKEEPSSGALLSLENQLLLYMETHEEEKDIENWLLHTFSFTEP